MARIQIVPALVAHGGAGVAGPRIERPERRRAMLAAMRTGAQILRDGGTALDAVVATVIALEDHPLFNAGYGSLLNSEGHVEMDASVMVAEPARDAIANKDESHAKRRKLRGSSGGSGTAHIAAAVGNEADSLHGFPRGRGRLSDLLSREHLLGSRGGGTKGRARERYDAVVAGTSAVLLRRTVMRGGARGTPSAVAYGRGTICRERNPGDVSKAGLTAAYIAFISRSKTSARVSRDAG